MAMVIEGVRYNEAEARFIEEMVSYLRNQTTARRVEDGPDRGHHFGKKCPGLTDNWGGYPGRVHPALIATVQGRRRLTEVNILGPTPSRARNANSRGGGLPALPV